jgi:hypothetical protein
MAARTPTAVRPAAAVAAPAAVAGWFKRTPGFGREAGRGTPVNVPHSGAEAYPSSWGAPRGAPQAAVCFLRLVQPQNLIESFRP